MLDMMVEKIVVVDLATIGSATIPIWVYVLAVVVVLAALSTSVALNFWVLRNK